MQLYNNEEEQLDAVRGFFRENGKFLAAGVVLVLVGFGGWKYWQSSQHETKLQSSLSYELAALKAQNGQPEDLAKFVAENKNSYGVVGALQLAQQLVEKSDFSGAQKQLVWAQSNTKDDNLLATINLRIARLQLQQKQPDDALKTLDQIKKGGWFAQAQEIRGDVLQVKGDLKGAREAYSQALEANPSPALQEMLTIKMNNLPA